ncbi:MAG: hypothetical protein D6688_14500, partial [Alphaproteobacteria bacterium]
AVEVTSREWQTKSVFRSFNNFLIDVVTNNTPVDHSPGTQDLVACIRYGVEYFVNVRYSYQFAGFEEDIRLAEVRYIVTAGYGDVSREFNNPVRYVINEYGLCTLVRNVTTWVFSSPAASDGTFEALIDVDTDRAVDLEVAVILEGWSTEVLIQQLALSVGIAGEVGQLSFQVVSIPVAEYTLRSRTSQKVWLELIANIHLNHAIVVVTVAVIGTEYYGVRARNVVAAEDYAFTEYGVVVAVVAVVLHAAYFEVVQTAVVSSSIIECFSEDGSDTVD